MADEAERRPAPRPGLPPAPTGTLAEILRDIVPQIPEGAPSDDLDRIERALTRLERVLRIPTDPETR